MKNNIKLTHVTNMNSKEQIHKNRKLRFHLSVNSKKGMIENKNQDQLK
jgi:hypothetical protein